ncbi:(Na+)-NQR maturation NqrM [Ferrimonas sediminicola]|uniref:(Na+)-NQR maturation NqrM n=1 Tax=Ferrimonas sediminicola TaxID=2569538 RepID=A0A4U1BDU0_9GAMM|nr:(Na+)-NQR maturation NqrM [Ferrimonas sediminicola]TKB49319.1 (Na+)-NQR maturation NqrM [Ferrimonas sediminicola]
MTAFATTFAIMLLVTLMMSIGYLFRRKSIAGSCGGLGGVGIDKVCDCPEPCDKRKAKMAREAEQARRQRFLEERIL